MWEVKQPPSWPTLTPQYQHTSTCSYVRVLYCQQQDNQAIVLHAAADRGGGLPGFTGGKWESRLERSSG